jgi:hypothetical protein
LFDSLYLFRRQPKVSVLLEFDEMLFRSLDDVGENPLRLFFEKDFVVVGNFLHADRFWKVDMQQASTSCADIGLALKTDERFFVAGDRGTKVARNRGLAHRALDLSGDVVVTDELLERLRSGVL